MIYSILTGVREVFGGTISAASALLGSLSLFSILGFFITIAKIVHDHKKAGKTKEETNAAIQKAIQEATKNHEAEIKQLKEQAKADTQKLADMLLLELTNANIPIDKVHAIRDLYLTITEDETKKQLAEEIANSKEEEAKEKEEKQKQVEENLKAISDLEEETISEYI